MKTTFFSLFIFLLAQSSQAVEPSNVNRTPGLRSDGKPRVCVEAIYAKLDARVEHLKRNPELTQELKLTVADCENITICMETADEISYEALKRTVPECTGVMSKVEVINPGLTDTNKDQNNQGRQPKIEVKQQTSSPEPSATDKPK